MLLAGIHCIRIIRWNDLYLVVEEILKFKNVRPDIFFLNYNYKLK